MKKEDVIKFQKTVGVLKKEDVTILDFLVKSALEKIEKEEGNTVLENPPAEFFKHMETYENTCTLIKEKYPKGIINFGMALDAILGEKSTEETTAYVHNMVNSMMFYGFLKSGKEKQTYEIVKDTKERINLCEDNLIHMKKSSSQFKDIIRTIEQVIVFKHRKAL